MSTKPHWHHASDYARTHARRFELSMEWLRPLLTPDARVLVCGDMGDFERSLLGQVQLVNCTCGDLRDGIESAAPSSHYDLVLCMEVLEHIHDRNAEKPTEWRATGTRSLLASIVRVLKPGGLLFLTTPNACSINVLFKVLTMQPPMVYRPHVREYAPSEVAEMLVAAGFEIARLDTCDPWGGGCGAGARRLVEKLLQDERHHSPHRGEDLFVLARKPARQS